MRGSIAKICTYSCVTLLTVVSMGSVANATIRAAVHSATFREAGSFSGDGHPAYLHALSSLRAARWMIEHKPGSWSKTMDEENAVREIDAAINEIKSAAIDDGKNINDHPQVEEHSQHGARLHAAVKFLKDARGDIARDEDNNFANGLRDRSYHHIDVAIMATKKAIHE